MAELLAAIVISLVVAYLWRRLERTRLGAALSWAIVYTVLIALVVLVSLSVGYAALGVLRAAH